MDVRCERCRAQYAFEDDQITPSGLTVQCNGCGHVFMVKKEERHPPPAPPRAPHHWTIRQASGQTLGFSELNTLQRWIVERKVARDDEVSQGDGAWVRLGTLAELQSFFEVVEEADRARGPSTARYPAVADTPPPPGPRHAAPPPLPAVDLDLDRAGLPSVATSGGSRLVVGLVLVVAAAAVTWLVAPALFQAAPPPPARVDPVPAPLAVASKPPEPAPPEPAPAPKPEPVPEPQPPPEAEPVAAPVAQAPEPTPDPAPRARPPTARQQLAEARRLRERGSTEQALDLYGKVASQDPGNAEALAGRGLCYFDLEQFAPAEATLQEALRVSPRQPDALMGLAETYRAQGRKAEAIAMFERYLAAHPGGDEAPLARNAINQLKE